MHWYQNNGNALNTTDIYIKIIIVYKNHFWERVLLVYYKVIKEKSTLMTIAKNK